MNASYHLLQIRVYLISFLIAWICLSVLVGLFQSFEILETSREVEAVAAFLAAIRVAMALIVAGIAIFGMPLFFYLRRKGNP